MARITRQTIELFRQGGMWQARFSDPEVVKLFGTDTLPTPFGEKLHASVVQREVCQRNPECWVSIRQ